MKVLKIIFLYNIDIVKMDRRLGELLSYNSVTEPETILNTQ